MTKYLGHEIIRQPETKGKITTGKQAIKLTRKQKQLNATLIETLEKDFLPVCRESLTKRRINQIGKFGQDLVSLGDQAKCVRLKEFGKELCANVESFDVETMISNLRSFPDIVKSLKTQMEE